MEQIDLREGARRQHRALAVFAMIQCWIRGWDGVAFERDHLERLVGLERFKGTRIDWLTEDLKDIFPFQQVLHYSSTEKFACVIMSRVDFSASWPSGSMPTKKRLASIKKKGGPVMGVFELWPRLKTWKKKKLESEFQGLLPILDAPANFDERLMHSYLELITGGLISPKSVFSEGK
jgi:hypothetical protein